MTWRLTLSFLGLLVLCVVALGQSLPFPGPGSGSPGGCVTTPIVLTATGSNTWDRSLSTASGCTSFKIEVVGGGASGGVSRAGTGTPRVGTGGGAGQYCVINPTTITAGQVTYSIGTGGTGVTRTTNGNTNGNAGLNTWFCNDTANCASEAGTAVVVWAGGGGAGNGANTTAVGGTGGTGGTLGTCNAGARGGDATVASGNPALASGAGGAGGSTAVGTNGTDINASVETASAGGQGDDSVGGAGTAGDQSGGVGSGNASNGTEFDASHGSGGGSGGVTALSAGSQSSGTGGQCGGATGGAAGTTYNATSGNAAAGCIKITPLS